MAIAIASGIGTLLRTPFPPPHLHHSKPKPKRPRHRHVAVTASRQDPLTLASRLLWGRSLPPPLLISAVRYAWSSTWHLMMRQLAPSSSSSYTRPPSAFPTVPPSTSPRRRLLLYVGLPCPWAHRTLIVRALKGLEPSFPVSVAVPGLDGSWELPDGSRRRRTLRDVYATRPGGYDGRATVPMLWDVEKGDVVCNESYGIIEFMNAIGGGIDLAPPELKADIEAWNRVIYPNVNNGVYRCGFAQSQEAYDVAVNDLFGTLDMLDDHLSSSRYLCGDVLTLADICLFTTLIRFDLAYNVLFKCTKKKLVEYSNLHGYTKDIYQIPKVAATCNFQAIMDGYYRTLFPLNPGNICPVTPSVCEPEWLNKPHGRESLPLKVTTS